MIDIFIARQPIYDSEGKLFAYDLLYCPNKPTNSREIDKTQANTHALMETLADIGLEKITDENKVLIKLSWDFLIGEFVIPLPANYVMLEFAEEIPCENDTMLGLDEFINMGFTIVAEYSNFDESRVPLLERANIIKIEFLEIGRQGLASELQKLSAFKTKLLISGIETYEDYMFCKGFSPDYYEGFYYRRPKIIKGKKIRANRLATLKLLALLQKPNVEIKDIENCIRQDVTLSMKLLRCINSAKYSLRRQVESIEQAIVYLGIQQIKQWITIIALAGIDDKPQELMRTSLIRSRMCELLAEKLKKNNIDSFTTIDLFSTIDALMDDKMNNVLSLLPFSDDINAALLTGDGELGSILSYVTAYDSGNWNKVTELSLDPQEIGEIYLQSIAWASEITEQLN